MQWYFAVRAESGPSLQAQVSVAYKLKADMEEHSLQAF
jgi:hypothetical protein